MKKIRYKVSDEDYVKIEDMTRRMIGRLLHYPTIKLREVAEKGDSPQDTANYSYMLKELFNLNGNRVDATQNKEKLSD